MRPAILVSALVVSVLLNVILGMYASVASMYRGMNGSRWNRQSLQVVEWCDKLATEHRPIAEAERFFGQKGDRFHWGIDHDDVWTIAFDVDDKSNIQSVQIDGYKPKDFADLYRP